MTGIGLRVEPPINDIPKVCDCCGTSRNITRSTASDGRIITLCIGCWEDPSLSYADCKHGKGGPK